MPSLLRYGCRIIEWDSLCCIQFCILYIIKNTLCVAYYVSQIASFLGQRSSGQISSINVCSSVISADFYPLNKHPRPPVGPVLTGLVSDTFYPIGPRAGSDAGRTHYSLIISYVYVYFLLAIYFECRYLVRMMSVF